MHTRTSVHNFLLGMDRGEGRDYLLSWIKTEHRTADPFSHKWGGPGILTVIGLGATSHSFVRKHVLTVMHRWEGYGSMTMQRDNAAEFSSVKHVKNSLKMSQTDALVSELFQREFRANMLCLHAVTSQGELKYRCIQCPLVSVLILDSSMLTHISGTNLVSFFMLKWNGWRGKNMEANGDPFWLSCFASFFSTKLNVREGVFPSTFRQGLHSTQNARQVPSLVRIRAQPRLPIIVLEVTTASLGSLPVPFTEHTYIYIFF